MNRNDIDASGRNTASVYIFIYCLNTIIINLDGRNKSSIVSNYAIINHLNYIIMFNILKYGIIAGLIFSANYINVRQDYVIAYAKVIEGNDTISLKTTVNVEEWENAIQRYITDSIANSLENNAVE